MQLCINCNKETTEEIWSGYPMCAECIGRIDHLSLFQLYHNDGEAGILNALEDIKSGRIKIEDKETSRSKCGHW